VYIRAVYYSDLVILRCNARTLDNTSHPINSLRMKLKVGLYDTLFLI
jgi:hypothetical protein